ncbi:hypothetical protein [Paracoccus sp. 22332]|uniref:hypothetical protein n=1 Tax=Paracoccus sp. 22332 TaxID=3453913 RepID=UPI003F85DACE
MIDPLVILTILMMALVTYLTRIDGYLLLRDRTVSRLPSISSPRKPNGSCRISAALSTYSA